MQRRNSQVTLKILIIGDSGVGKTNILSRYVDNGYKQNYVATIGIDFKIKAVTVDGMNMRLQIWDTAGQERFKNITNTFYKGAAGVIVAFSITDPISFQNVSNWIKQINNNLKEDIATILVGTKADLGDERKVSREQAENFAAEHRIQYIETSSKTSHNIDLAFEQLVKRIKDRKEGPLNEASKGTRLQDRENNSDKPSSECKC